MPCTYVSIVDFEQILVCWEVLDFSEMPYIQILVKISFIGEKDLN